MITKVKIYVEEDFAGEMYFKENPREYWQKYLDTCKQNPIVVLIEKNNQVIPVEGMIYQNQNFLDSVSGKTFIPNNIQPDFERFAFIVDGVYLASHDVSISSMPSVIAAYQSNPRFVITVEEELLGINFG
jgi:hypothetical protein